MSAKTTLAAVVAAIAVFIVTAPVALANGSVPSVSGEVLLGVCAVTGAIIIWIVIRAALNISGDDDDDDKAGVGILDGIDDDDKEK